MKTWFSTLHPAARLVLVALMIVAVAAIALLLVFVPRIPSFDALINANQPAIQIRITAPESHASYPANAALEVEAEIWSEEPLIAYELWVNGINYANPPSSTTEDSPLGVIWIWTPGAAGTYTLLVKASDVDGDSVFSSSIQITASEPVGAQLLLPVGAGEDPRAVAEAAGLDPDAVSLREAQPGSPAGGFIVHDIPPGETSPPDQPAAPVFNIVETGPAQPFTRLGEINFWLQTQAVGAATPPEAPLLAARVEGCTPVLSIQSGPGVDGIAVYRVYGGATPPKKIAYFYPDPDVIREYTAEESYGPSTYFVSSVSPGGETPSDPVSVEILDPTCAPPESGGLQIEGNDILTPEGVDRLYLYYSISDGLWNRFPFEPQVFLTGGTNAFDISPLLQTIRTFEAGAVLSMDVWGWQNGILVNLGQLAYSPGLTDLYVCSHAGTCRGGVEWTAQSLIADDEEDLIREFQWSSSTLPVTGGIWQISSQPFGNTLSLNPPGLIASGDAGEYYGVGAQSFSLDLSAFDLGSPDSSQPAVEAPGTSAWILEELGRIVPSPMRWTDNLTMETPYYVRVIPMAGDTPSGTPSPSALIYFGPASEQENPLIEYPPPLPSIYTVNIDNFTNITPPYLPWGCVQIVSIDEDFIPQAMGGASQYTDLLAAMNASAAYCPSVYSGEGEPGALESFADFATSAVTWVSEFYEALKNEIVNIVADILNAAIPGLCEGSAEEGSTCHQYLKGALEAGLIALGIPPELPNAERLIRDGKDYLIEELAEEIGPECGSYCREKLDEALDEVIEMLGDEQLARACGDVELAHSNGREPLCLPPGVEAVPHPGSSWQPARVDVTISRNADSEVVSPENLAKYRFHLSLVAVNEYLAGQSLWVNTSLCYKDGPLFECNPQLLTLTDAPRAALFSEIWLDVLPLPPGESISIPFNVFPEEYFLPGHRELMESVGGGYLYDDWWTLFYGAELTISAVVECPYAGADGFSTDSWELCGQGDELQLTMPDSVWE